MTARSEAHGHKIFYDGEKWRWRDTGEEAGSRPCKRCGKKPIVVYVKIPADLSCTGQEKWQFVHIDACIAPIVDALQTSGIDMRGSCCGHGNRPGEIALQDGRTIIFPRSWELPLIRQWEIRGEHPYWYGVWYVYRPGPFICS
jgi:hypothetical protein